jgi:hypothetical protein
MAASWQALAIAVSCRFPRPFPRSFPRTLDTLLALLIRRAVIEEHMFKSTSDTLQTDYLVIGAGAMGMAFADTIVAESQASVIIVDRHDQPGGHWNDAYPFVRLHSASAYYGVNSRALGCDTIDEHGLNRGFHERASAAEICSYFDRLMRKQLLPSGRVRYFPLCDYRGDSTFVSLTSGAEYRVSAKNVVDATFTDTAVPSRKPPQYEIATGVRCITPNALPNGHRDIDQYVIIGAGKTGIDVCLWLLEHDVPTERITWIMPRDSWLLDRAHVEPREAFFAERMGSLALQTELIQQAESIEHLFDLLHARGQLLRIDERVKPQRYRCATVSQAELAQLRRITNVVRLGHVRRISAQKIELELGSIATSARTLHIDCSASALNSRAPVQVFGEGTITLQPVRTCQQCFSSALIAHVELTYETIAEKNRLCAPISLPLLDIDWLKMLAANLKNQAIWLADAGIRNWIANSRLDLNYGRTHPLTSHEESLLQRFKSGAGPAMARLNQLLSAAS